MLGDREKILRYLRTHGLWKWTVRKVPQEIQGNFIGGDFSYGRAGEEILQQLVSNKKALKSPHTQVRQIDIEWIEDIQSAICLCNRNITQHADTN